MSECTGPTTMSVPKRYRLGRAGYAIPETELKVAEDGEILMRGPHVFNGYNKSEEATRETLDAEGWIHSGDVGEIDADGFLRVTDRKKEILMRGPHDFKGYYKNEEATRETLDADGWIHSGDVGELDADGFVRVTDRKKELLITSGGKNIAPQHLEGKLKQIPAVSQAVAIGDRRHYVVALLALDPARVAAEAEKAGSPARTPDEAARCPVFKAYVEKQVEEVNQSLARYESIKKIALLPKELSVETGELTPTLKLKRRVIHERHKETIEALYA
jgi:long-subunit acyl-CoA synthetase (AMP-forming)